MSCSTLSEAKKKMTRPEYVIVERDSIASCLSCHICNGFYEEATTVTSCLHTFCRTCIVERLKTEDACPICNVHLGATPLDKLRPDHNLQSLRTKFFPPQPQDFNQTNNSQYVPQSEPVVDVERIEPISSPNVNNPAKTTRSRKKTGRRKSSAEHAPGLLINEPLADIEAKLEEKKQAPRDAETIPHKAKLKGKEINDTLELVKPLNNLAIEHGSTEDPVDKSVPPVGIDPKSKGKGVVVETPPLVQVTVDNENGNIKGKKKENYGAGSSGTGTGTIAGTMASSVTGNVTGTVAGGVARQQQTNNNVTSIWFSLVASKDPNRAMTLQQIPANFLRIKDGNMTISTVQKYIVQKLGLSSDTEVEIRCENLVVSPTMTMQNLVELWLETRPKQKVKASVGKSAKEFVMVLHYKRAKIN